MAINQTAEVSQAIKWHGGKAYLAKRIVELMPSHVHYVEPYFGGGSVLFAKDPEGVSEVANDLNGDLINFWKTLACPPLFDKMIRILQATPCSELVFDSTKPEKGVNKAFWSGLFQDGSETLLSAINFFIRNRQSRQALGRDFATLSRTRTRRGMNELPSAWLTAIDGLPEVHARLKRVVILNRDALEVIRTQDGPDTLFYLDPPYLHETRNSTGEYQHEMTDFAHDRLLSALVGIKGKFMLSGYPSELYDSCASLYCWHHIDFDLPNNASGSKTKERKTERLWMNFEPTKGKP